jgi:hypothetical protein
MPGHERPREKPRPGPTGGQVILLPPCLVLTVALLLVPLQKLQLDAAVRARVTVERAVAADRHALWLAGLVRLTTPDAAPPVSLQQKQSAPTLSTLLPKEAA